MKFENTEVWGFKHAIRGMRNPMNSWGRSDSGRGERGSFAIGEDDLKLAQKLIRAGSVHRKFMRQIFVSVDITAPMFWWSEADTYKIGTVRNSCSKMHKIHSIKFSGDNFAHTAIDEIPLAKEMFRDVINTLEACREKFNETGEKLYWRAIIELLPESYEMKSTVTMNYENIFSICSKDQRRNHKLNEWSGIDNPDLPNFISWARSLPYARELIFLDEMG